MMGTRLGLLFFLLGRRGHHKLFHEAKTIYLLRKIKVHIEKIMCIISGIHRPSLEDPQVKNLYPRLLKIRLELMSKPNQPSSIYVAKTGTKGPDRPGFQSRFYHLLAV